MNDVYRWKIEHYEGNIVISEYEKGLYKGKRKWSVGKRLDVSTEERKERDKQNKIRSLRRTAKKIQNITRSNFMADRDTKLLTLTYKSNMQCWDKLVLDWQTFYAYLCETENKQVKYIAVPETQDRGAWHLHVITAFTYIDWSELISAWRRATGEDGGLWISSRKGKPLEKAAAGYLSNYLTQEEYMAGHPYPRGKKRYWTNLKDKTVTTYCNTAEVIDDVLDLAAKNDLVLDETTYESEHLGKIRKISISTGKADLDPLIYSIIDYKDNLIEGRKANKYYEFITEKNPQYKHL